MQKPSLLKTVQKAHQFFMTEGINFVTTYKQDYSEYTNSWFREKYISPENKRYMPIAYIRFMYFTLKDWFHTHKSY